VCWVVFVNGFVEALTPTLGRANAPVGATRPPSSAPQQAIPAIVNRIGQVLGNVCGSPLIRSP
jgi:hypothetical protein